MGKQHVVNISTTTKEMACSLQLLSSKHKSKIKNGFYDQHILKGVETKNKTKTRMHI